MGPGAYLPTSKWAPLHRSPSLSFASSKGPSPDPAPCRPDLVHGLTRLTWDYYGGGRLSVGGELVGSMIFAIESVPPHRQVTSYAYLLSLSPTHTSYA
eukprot:3920705-Rhodomonas_salina.6